MDIQQQFKAYNPPVKDARRLPFVAPAKLVGRNPQLAALHALLKAGKAALIVGGAGTGKTAHCAFLSAALTATQPGGVLWLTVQEDDAAHLIARVGRAYGVDTYSADPTTNAARLRSLLSAARPFIVLDGVPDLEAVASFAARCAPGLPLLVSVESEAQPAGFTAVSLPALSTEDGATLYATLADNAPPPPTSTETPTLVERLGGNPSAILIAARLAAQEKLIPAHLVAALPATPAEALPALLNLAVMRLPAPLSGLLTMLAGLFTSGASLRVLSAMSSIPEDKLIAPMRVLVWRGLVTETALMGVPAFALPELVRGHLRASLRERGQLVAVESRTLEVLRAYAAHCAKLGDVDGLATEIDNLLGAAAFATENRDTASLQMLIDSLSIAEGRGFKPEGDKLRQLRAIISRATPPREGETESASSTALLMEMDSGATPIIQPLAAEVNALRAAAAPHTPIQLPPIEKTQSASPTVATPAPVSVAVERAAETLTAQPAESTRPAQATDPLDVLDGLDDDPDSVIVVGSAPSPSMPPAPPEMHDDDDDSADLGEIGAIREYVAENDHAGVIVKAGTYIVLADKRKDHAMGGQLRLMLGDSQRAIGEHEAALQTYRQAVENFRAAESWPNVATALNRLAVTYIEMGRWDDAALMQEQAAVIYHRFGLVEDENTAIAQIAQAAADLRQYPKAGEYYARALYLARERADRRAEARYLIALAHNSYLQRHFEESVGHYRAALHCAYLLDDAALQAEISGQLGRLLLEDVRTLNQAVQLAREAVAAAPGDATLRRLLKRAESRLNNVNKGGLNVAPAEGSNREYAAGELPA